MPVQSDADYCTPGHTLYIPFSVERATNVVDLHVSGDVVELPLTQYDTSCGIEHVL